MGSSQKKNRNTSEIAVSKLQKNRQNQPSIESITKGIFSGNLTALSRGITLVESQNNKHIQKASKLIKACLPKSGNSIRIGITGVPGVGKSTFIEALGELVTNLGKKVAVLAIDPSSSISKGSILGDKTRMESLVKNKLAFIRPSASSGSLGGVAQRTRETIALCEAAGYEIILIETVGVGQSEIAVHSMVDFFLLLKLSGAGDELQGIKRGIIEMSDAIVINKADGNNIKKAKTAQNEFRNALHLYPIKDSGWRPKVLLCSALENEGVDLIWKQIISYVMETKKSGYFQQNRVSQNKYWLMQTIEDRLKNNFYNRTDIKEELKIQLELLNENKVSPFTAANYLLSI